MGQKRTLEDFIKLANEKHNNKYDYSKVDYINNITKICIICPKHGEFWQTPKDHLNNCGCPECWQEKRGKSLRKNCNTFIKQANEVHGDKYNYSKTDYVSAHVPIIITCPIHGDFSMTAHNHLRGQGCPKCANLKKGDYQKSNTEDFIQKSRLVHGDKYDYSKVDYINNRVKVCIICPEHGEFWQKPLDHIHGRGCSECGKRFGISEKMVLNFMRDNFDTVSYQYTPKWLYGKTSPQSLDIYLPEYKIAIEYHGRQHFYPNHKFGGEEGFVLIQERDRRKYEKCLKNGVQVFYISYENKIPDDYFAPVYRSNEDLLNAINKHIEEQSIIKLSENDFKKIICESIRQIIETTKKKT
jgi:hypothetical protein